MKLLKALFVVFVIASLFSSCTSFHKCEAYTYQDDPVQMKQAQPVEDVEMMKTESVVAELRTKC